MRFLMFFVLLGVAGLVCAKNLQENGDMEMLHSRNKRHIFEKCNSVSDCRGVNRCCVKPKWSWYSFCVDKYTLGENCFDMFKFGCGCADNLECKPYRHWLGLTRYKCVAKPSPPPPTEPAGSGDGF